MPSPFFPDIDFTAIAAAPDFKEASVRSFIIDPLIKKLGYTADNIVLEKTVQIQSGSKQKTTAYFADYALTVPNSSGGKSFVCVIEAKPPQHNLSDAGLIEQAFSYASHREIRSNYFVLCNGLELALHRTDLDRTQVLRFSLQHLSEEDADWQELKRYLSPESFHGGKPIQYEKPQEEKYRGFDTETYCYKMLPDPLTLRRQSARRHFGVHGYFTRQPHDIVLWYIMNYTRSGDIVLDPFGGSGVTAMEASLHHRKGINVDINPLSVFIVKALMTPVMPHILKDTYELIKSEYLKREPKTKKEIAEALKKYPGPKPLLLPKGSDVKTADKLFNKKQLAQLSLLKSLIMKISDKNVRNTFLLMFSGLVSKINLTYHQSSGRSEGRGNASPFQYYRYRLAPHPAELDVMKYFDLRYKKVTEAKEEIAVYFRSASNYYEQRDIQVIKGSATDLSSIESESVDYIYTDPPYGANIQYLDLSAMWNAWLDLDVTDEDYALEAIEDGKLEKSKAEYKKLIADSIGEMFRVLKFNRWLTFVFQHKDPEYWDLIVNTAEQCGFEYVGAVAQPTGKTSFKKRQRPWKTLSGQLMLNFRKIRNPKTLMKANLGSDMTGIVLETIEGIIAKHNGATLEQINTELIKKGLELGFLDLLSQQFSDLTPLLQKEFMFDGKSELYTIPPNRSFKTHIDLHLRIKYYLMSYLTRCERQHQTAHFDDIVLAVMPSLKNGATPEKQTIESVLNDIAEKYGSDCWRLKKDGQREFVM